MAIIQAACPVCSGLSDQRLIHPPDINLIECSICGRFSIENDYITKIDRDKYASYLFYNCNLFSSINDKKKVFYFIGSDISYKDILFEYPSDIRHLRKEDVDNWYPKKFSEKIDYILLGLAQLSDYTGKSISLIGQKANSLFFVKRYTDDNLLPNEKINEQTEYYYNYLSSLQLIKQNYSMATLLPEGLRRIDELQKNQAVSKQVFIAISFSDDMIKVQEAIEEGIRKAGYIPHTMNRNEHNNQIVPEILFQIRQSKFVVAEFSTGNNGAYYEAGYAAGLGKEVIHICNTEKFRKKGHFDIKQKSTVLWNTVEEIPDALCKRIIATII